MQIKSKMQVQQQHTTGATGDQDMNPGGMMAMSHQDELREKAAAQMVTHEIAVPFGSAHTGILQTDGPIKKGTNIAGSENSELDHDVTIQADHFNVHLLWRK